MTTTQAPALSGKKRGPSARKIIGLLKLETIQAERTLCDLLCSLDTTDPSLLRFTLDISTVLERVIERRARLAAAQQ